MFSFVEENVYAFSCFRLLRWSNCEHERLSVWKEIRKATVLSLPLLTSKPGRTRKWLIFFSHHFGWDLPMFVVSDVCVSLCTRERPCHTFEPSFESNDWSICLNSRLNTRLSHLFSRCVRLQNIYAVILALFVIMAVWPQLGREDSYLTVETLRCLLNGTEKAMEENYEKIFASN